MPKSLLFSISHTPKTHPLVIDALDAALTAAILGSDFNVLLINEGCELINLDAGKEKLEQLLSMKAKCIAIKPIIADPFSTPSPRGNNFRIVNDQQIQALLNESTAVLSF